jgi:histidine triad (HIT) family protein
VETVGDLPAALTAPLWDAVRVLARAVEGALGADGSFVAANNRVSQSVPHLHVHVVPRRRGDGLRGFFWPRGRYADGAEMEAIRRRIAGAVAGLG